MPRARHFYQIGIAPLFEHPSTSASGLAPLQGVIMHAWGLLPASDSNPDQKDARDSRLAQLEKSTSEWLARNHLLWLKADVY